MVTTGRSPMGRRAVLLVGAALTLALVVVGGVAGVHWWRDSHRTELQRAVGYAPSSTLRMSWTDWDGVRSRLHDDVDRGSSVAQVQRFLSRAYDADLTSGSAMIESAPILQDTFGFSPADVDWELLAQGKEGSVLILGLPGSLGADALGATFTRLGYSAPSSATSGSDGTGVYLGGAELLSRLTVDSNKTISPQFQNLALDAGRHLLLASDSGPYLRDTLAGLDQTHSPGGDGLAAVAAAVGEPLSGELYAADYVCQYLAMGQADDTDEQTGKELIARAGGVDPLDGFAIVGQSDGDVLVAMSFDDDDAARHNADSRATLAAGPAPGQGGDFSDRFELGPVTADGSVVTMRLEPRSGESVLSDLSTGPVLFASC